MFSPGPGIDTMPVLETDSASKEGYIMIPITNGLPAARQPLRSAWVGVTLWQSDAL